MSPSEKGFRLSASASSLPFFLEDNVKVKSGEEEDGMEEDN